MKLVLKPCWPAALRSCCSSGVRGADPAHDDDGASPGCAGQVDGEPRFFPLAFSVSEQAAEHGKYYKQCVQDQHGIGQQAGIHVASWLVGDWTSSTWPSI